MAVSKSVTIHFDPSMQPFDLDQHGLEFRTNDESHATMWTMGRLQEVRSKQSLVYFIYVPRFYKYVENSPNQSTYYHI